MRLEALTIPVPDAGAAAARYRVELGIEVDAAGTARVGDQVIALVPADDGVAGTPVIDLVGERGSPPWTSSCSASAGGAAPPDARADETRDGGPSRRTSYVRGRVAPLPCGGYA